MYNEGPNVTPLLMELEQVLQTMGLPESEVIIVNDGSTDDTEQLLRKRVGGRIRAISLKCNCGQSAALEVGFRSARGKWVATLDADLQNDPRDIANLLPLLGEYDLVCGVRRRRQDNGLRRLSSRIANAVRSSITRDNCSDTGCSLKVFRRSALEQIPMFRGSHRFLPALFQMQGFRVTERAVHHRPRVAGLSKYGTLDRLVATLPDLLAVAWMRSRAHRYVAREIQA